MILHAVEALVCASITDLMIVTGGPYAGEFLKLLGDGRSYGIDRLTYAYQPAANGIADALRLAEHFSEKRPFVLFLGDNIFEYSLAPAFEAFSARPVGAQVVLTRLSDVEQLRRVGVAELDEDQRIVRIVEKPSAPAQPPSNFAVTGVYCYDATVFDVAASLTPSSRGELEITDVNAHYIRRGLLKHAIIDGFWADAGQSIEAYEEACECVRTRGVNKPSESLIEAVDVKRAAARPATSG
jgi:glucose-1-phosphate thymidylyltransferase